MGHSVHIAHFSRPGQRCGCVTAVPGGCARRPGQCSAHRQTALRPEHHLHPGPDQTGGPQTAWWGSPRVSAHPSCPGHRAQSIKQARWLVSSSLPCPHGLLSPVYSMPSAMCPPALGSGLESLCSRSLHHPVVRGGGRGTVGPLCPQVLRPGLQPASHGTHWAKDVRLSLSCAGSSGPDGCCVYTERGPAFLVMTPETM